MKEAHVLGTILIVFAFVLSLIEAFRPWAPPIPRPHLGWLSLSLYFLSLLIGALRF